MHMQRCHFTSATATCSRMNPLRQSCQLKSAAPSMRHRLAACSSSSSSSSRGGGRQASRPHAVSDTRRVLGDFYEPYEAAEVDSVLTESEGAGMLPGMGDEHLDITLKTHPKQFKQALEADFERSVLLSKSELEAKGRVIKGVVQALQQGSSNLTIQLGNQTLPVGIDRVAVAGSAGKNVTVQGLFDVDLVAFVNLPAGVRVDLLDPNTCLQEGSWFKQLQAQLPQLLQRELAFSPGLQLVCVQKTRPNSAAVHFTVAGQIPGSDECFELECELVLAPNLATGAGAEAAAEYGVVPLKGEAAADTQRRAVLAPVLQLADGVRPAYLRSPWLAEACTEFVQQAAATVSGLSGRVVTSTIRLVKAWVRKGLQLQPQYVSGRTGKPIFRRLKSLLVELLVLRAAQRFGTSRAGRLPTYDQQQYEGGYVLDLLLEVLVVAQEWAGSMVESDPAFHIKTRVMFTELALPDNKYYSRPEADAVDEMLGWKTVEHKNDRVLALRVLHPVDPTEDVLLYRGKAPDSDTLLMWGALRHEAKLLYTQLCEESWRDIKNNSTLGPVFRP